MNTKIKKIAIALLCVIVIILISGLAILNHYYNQMNHSGTHNTINEDDLIANAQDDSLTNSDLNDIDAMNKAILENLEKDKEDIIFSDNVFNILLIGSDERAGVDGSRSDSIILLSINKETKELILTSFLRDMYVSIDGYKNNRINAAYSFGGPELLMDTIENNFKIKIDRYAQVDFFSLIEIIDTLGGIDNIQISEDEMELINSYAVEVNLIRDLPADYESLDKYGLISLNGTQALSYSRIRYVTTGFEDNDFGRTYRQRVVLKAMFDKIKKADVFQLKELLDTFLPLVDTNITQGEFLSLILDSGDYKNYELVSQRVPYDGTYEDMVVNKMSVLSVDFDANIDMLLHNIYNHKNKIVE